MSRFFKVETRAERERRQLADRMTTEQRDLNRRFLDARPRPA